MWALGISRSGWIFCSRPVRDWSGCLVGVGLRPTPTRREQILATCPLLREPGGGGRANTSLLMAGLMNNVGAVFRTAPDSCHTGHKMAGKKPALPRPPRLNVELSRPYSAGEAGRHPFTGVDFCSEGLDVQSALETKGKPGFSREDPAEAGPPDEQVQRYSEVHRTRSGRDSPFSLMLELSIGPAAEKPITLR